MEDATVTGMGCMGDDPTIPSSTLSAMCSRQCAHMGMGTAVQHDTIYEHAEVFSLGRTKASEDSTKEMC
jgi:hypothetical protein